MPIVEFHLVDGQYRAEQHERLLVDASRFFAEVLGCPVDRIRALVHLHRPELVAVGGEVVERSGTRAPYFHFVVLEGRPVEQRHKLLAGFTDIVVAALGVDRTGVRGACRRIAPEDWAIGGTPASVQRAGEIQARART